MAAIAHTVAFCAALTCCIGFNDPTQVALNQNGFNTILDLSTVHESDLDRLPKHLDEWHDSNAAPQDQVRIPFVSLKKLKAMRYWALSERHPLGHVAPSATAFTNAVLEETLLKMQADDDYEAAMKETAVQCQSRQLAKAWELPMIYLSRTKGAANTPLTYCTFLPMSMEM
jgi:hypothetical protein